MRSFGVPRGILGKFPLGVFASFCVQKEDYIPRRLKIKPGLLLQMCVPHGNEMGAVPRLTYGGATAFPPNNKPAARFSRTAGVSKLCLR